MDTPREKSYRSAEASTLAVFDVRVPGIAERLHRERAAWAEYADIEALDQNHYVLIVRPGVALVEIEDGR